MLKLGFPEGADSEPEKMENEEAIAVNLLDAQFYDDEQVALVLQTAREAGTGKLLARREIEN